MGKNNYFPAAAAIYLIAICLIWFGPLKRLAVTDWNNGYYFSKQFDSLQGWVNTKNIDKIGGSVIDDGNRVTYSFKKRPGDRVIVRLLYGIPFQGSANNEDQGFKGAVFTAGNVEKALPKQAGYVLFRGQKEVTDADAFGLTLEKGKDLLGVRRIEVSVLPPKKEFLPNLPLFGLLLSLPFLAGGFLSNRKKDLIYHIVAAVIFTGAAMRWQEIERVSFAPAHPDIHQIPMSGFGHYEYALNMKLFDKERGFLASTHEWHEPGYALIMKAVVGMIGVSPLHCRFISFFFSVLGLILVFLIGRYAVGSYPALLATGLLSINSFMVEQASYGLRTELEMVMLLLFFWLSFYGLKKMRLSLWCITTGLLAAFWLMLRSFNLIFIIIIGAVSIASGRIGLKRALVAFLAFIIITLSLFVPYKYNVYKKHGSPFWDSNRYAVHHAHYEFGDRVGLPDEKINMASYLFRLHTPAQFIIYNSAGFLLIGAYFYEELFSVVHPTNNLVKNLMASGLKDTFLNYRADLLLSLALFLLFVFSLICGSFNKGSWQLWLAIIIAISFNAFLYGVMVFKKGGALEGHRSLVYALPLVAYIFSGGLCRILKIKEV